MGAGSGEPGAAAGLPCHAPGGAGPRTKSEETLMHLTAESEPL